MPRQRSSSLPRGFSVAGSPSRVRYHPGHDSQQTRYSKLRASASDVIYSKERRSLRNPYLLLLEEARDGEESKAARHSSEIQAVMPPPISEAGEPDSSYSCGPGRSVPSIADFSDSELDPQDSISNRGPSPSKNGRNWPFEPAPGWCNVHGCYMSGEFFDPKYRAWMQVVQPRKRFQACLCQSLDPSALLALYSEERNTRQDSGDRDRYDGDFEEPFAPRYDSYKDSRGSSLNVDWDHWGDPDPDYEQDWQPRDDWSD